MARKRKRKPTQTLAKRARRDSSRGGRPLFHFLVRELVSNADILDRWSLRRDTAHRMREWSPEIAGIYEEWVLPVRMAKASIMPPEGNDTPEIRKNGIRLQQAVRQGKGLRQVVGHLCEEPWEGHGIVELLGEFGLGNLEAGEDPIPGATRIAPEAIRYDTDGVPIVQDRFGTFHDIDDEKNRWRFITAQWGFTVGMNPYGLPLKHRCYWAWHFMTFAKKFWLTALERFGMPTLFVKITDGEWEEQRDAWVDIINDYVAQGGVIYPGDAGAEVTLENSAPRSFPGYKDFVAEFRRAIRFAILGGTFEDSAKAPAQAAKGRHIETTLRQQDLVSWVETLLTDTLIRYLSEMLFGEYQGHRLVLDLGDPREIQTRLAQLDHAQRINLKIRKSEAYEATGFTIPNEHDTDEDLIDLALVEPATMGFPAIGGFTGFAEPIVQGGEKLIGGRPEEARFRQQAHLGEVAAVQGAKALQDIERILKERARPFVGRAASPPSSATPTSS